MSASGLETDKDLWATKPVAQRNRITEQMKRGAFTEWSKTRPILRSKSDLRKQRKRRRDLLARPDEEVEEFAVALAVHGDVEGHDLEALGGCLAVDGELDWKLAATLGGHHALEYGGLCRDTGRKLQLHLVALRGGAKVAHRDLYRLGIFLGEVHPIGIGGHPIGIEEVLVVLFR